MSKKQELIDLVVIRMMNTATRVDLQFQRLPTPEEFAIDIVEFLYGVADIDAKKDEPKEEEIQEE